MATKNKNTIPRSTEDYNKYTLEDFYSKLQELFFKIKNDYKHTNVKKAINNVLEEIKNLFEFTNKQIDSLEKTTKKYSNIYEDSHKLNLPVKYSKFSFPMYGAPLSNVKVVSGKICFDLSELSNRVSRLGTIITDLFFLRRFLDKDYITNAVVYSGLAHSCQYIYVLIKYFDFKITNYYFLGVTPEKYYTMIKKSDSIFDYKLIKLIWPTYFYQCTDMSIFPKDFD